MAGQFTAVQIRKAGNGKLFDARGLFLEKLGIEGRPHGFRTSFRTWVQDTDACSFEVGETILGHTIGSKFERSYARSDLLDRRAPVMQAWANFVTGQSHNVVTLRR